jgi:hypothetical protein
MTGQPITTKTPSSEVGYKRPPVKSQFRKGQSGNPRGRRKGQRNLAPVLREVLGQTVRVKRGAKTQRMSKGDALIQMLLSMAHGGDARAIKAVLQLTEKIARIHIPEPKPAGVGNYEFMVVPGVAASREEWERGARLSGELATIRKIVESGEAAGKFLDAGQRATLRQMVGTARATGITITTRQLDALRESLGLARVEDATPTVTRRPVTRRPVNRKDTAAPTAGQFEQQGNNASSAPAQTATLTPTPPCVQPVARTPTYRKVNRRQPCPPSTGT